MQNALFMTVLDLAPDGKENYPEGQQVYTDMERIQAAWKMKMVLFILKVFSSFLSLWMIQETGIGL